MKSLIERLAWLNEPPWGWDNDVLWIRTRADTDFWQRTHYGFRRDNAHALATPAPGDFRLRGRFRFAPNARYDQCGLLVRADADCWFQVLGRVRGPVHQPAAPDRVVTNAGWSDWATQDVSSDLRTVSYEVAMTGSDLVARWSADGRTFHQLRVAHLAAKGPRKRPVRVQPDGLGFRFEVLELTLESPPGAPSQPASPATPAAPEP